MGTLPETVGTTPAFPETRVFESPSKAERVNLSPERGSLRECARFLAYRSPTRHLGVAWSLQAGKSFQRCALWQIWSEAESLSGSSAMLGQMCRLKCSIRQRLSPRAQPIHICEVKVTYRKAFSTFLYRHPQRIGSCSLEVYL